VLPIKKKIRTVSKPFLFIEKKKIKKKYIRILMFFLSQKFSPIKSVKKKNS